LILVDSSVWVDFFSRSPGRGGNELRRLIEQSEPIAVAGVVVTEVLQGLIRDAGMIERFLRQWDLLEAAGFETYRAAASIFRTARGKGIALTTIDALIAAIAIEHRASVFTLGHDFTRIALVTGLALHRF
jgi:predicted nucleic acid-binding protein